MNDVSSVSFLFGAEWVLRNINWQLDTLVSISPTRARSPAVVFGTHGLLPEKATRGTQNDFFQEVIEPAFSMGCMVGVEFRAVCWHFGTVQGSCLLVESSDPFGGGCELAACETQHVQ